MIGFLDGVFMFWCIDVEWLEYYFESDDVGFLCIFVDLQEVLKDIGLICLLVMMVEGMVSFFELWIEDGVGNLVLWFVDDMGMCIILDIECDGDGLLCFNGEIEVYLVVYLMLDWVLGQCYFFVFDVVEGQIIVVGY